MTRMPVLLLLLGALLSPGCQRDHTLSAQEVRALFSNRTVRGFHHRTQKSFFSYYEASGVFRSRRDGEALRTGTWRVHDDGIFCVRWDDEGEDYCRLVLRDSKGRYRKVRVKPGGGQVVKVSFESFVAGNTKGL